MAGDRILRRTRKQELGRIGGVILVGLLTGIMAVAFHAVMNLAEGTRGKLLEEARSHTIAVKVLVVLACGVMAGLSVFLVRRFAPEAEGSGIAAVLSARHPLAPVRAWRVLWVKFVGGFLGLASGMPLGREGPSVQIGAMVGLLTRRHGYRWISRSRCLHLGAAAGLAAAFNAPLTGIFFSFELLRQPFNPRNCLETVLCCAVGDWVCRYFHGPVLELPIAIEGARNWYELPTFLLAGIWTGVVVAVFQVLVTRFSKGAHSIGRSVGASTVVAFLLGLLLGLMLLEWPDCLGIGHELFASAIANRMPLALAGLALAARLLLTSGSYSTGAPGGLIVPALLFGVLSGQIFFGVFENLAGSKEADFHAVCLVAGMAASIGGLFRTPLTAMILSVEITGTYACLLEVSLAYLASHAVLGIAGLPDLYTALAAGHGDKKHQ